MSPLVRLRSAGWLVREDEESITLALDRDDKDESFRDITHIPKVCIVRVQRLKVK
jgi:hypothetical protein